MQLILAGNPNSGKTTVFNHLTGSRRHIGNFPGVTVDFKIGGWGNDEIVDLPGIYSLHPASAEERVAVEYFKKNPPQGIINCIDMTNLRRSLLLTLALMEFRIPMIIVANMLNECNPPPDLKQLERKLGIPIFPVHRQNGWDPAAMMKLIHGEIRRNHRPTPPCSGGAKEKYHWIDGNIPITTSPRKSSPADRILLHPLWGTVIFILLMGVIFDLTFHRIGPALTAPFLRASGSLTAMAQFLHPPLLRTLIQGAIQGVGTVFSFLPAMMVLFFFLALLEDSGYMVRICYLAENIMNKPGLSGKSIVPLMIGFGCSVPAVMAARTLGNTTQQRRTIRLIPFMSCSAKLPIYGMLVSILCPHRTFWLIVLLYLINISAGFLITLLSPREHTPLMLEKPPYRLPKLKNLWHRLWGQTKGFIQKAFSVLLLASLVAALLQQFTPQLQYTEDPAKSILALLAGLPAPLFRPIKLDHWMLIAPLLAGFFAKESVVSVLTVLAPGAAVLGTHNVLPFLFFVLFYPPCVAAMTTIRKETDRPFTVVTFFLHFGIAYLAAWIAANI